MRAKACRKALDATLKRFVQRERLDAHGRSYMRSATYIESFVKHQALPAEESRVLEGTVRKINSVLRQMQNEADAQRNAIDEKIL